jgi:hypothetical protein
MLVAFVAVIAGLAFIAWLNLPEPEPIPLMVIAADNVTVPGAPVSLRAWLRPVRKKDEDVALGGHEVFFLDAMLAGPGAARPAGRLREKVATGEDWEASLEWQPPDNPPPTVVVRFPGMKYPSYDMARIFVWPAQSKVLIVEARHGMMSVDEKTFQKAHVTQVAPLPGVTEALVDARKRKYQIVYFAVAPDRPERYRKLRGWLQGRLPNGREIFPDGPALGRASYADDTDETTATRDSLRALKRHFGRLVGVVGRPRDAKTFAKEGVKTILVAEDGEPRDGVKTVKSWQDVASSLP